MNIISTDYAFKPFQNSGEEDGLSEYGDGKLFVCWDSQPRIILSLLPTLNAQKFYDLHAEVISELGHMDDEILCLATSVPPEEIHLELFHTILIHKGPIEGTIV